MPRKEPLTAASRSASGRMMFGLLPPSSSVTRFSARPHLAPISRPTAVEPVNATLSTPGWSTSAAPVSPSPVSTFSVPSGKPGLERELAEAQRGQRRLLGGLEHQRAARGERRGDLPDRHQQREVPGHDLRADADRLAQRVTEQVAGARPGSSRPRSSSASRRSSAGGRPRRRCRPAPRRAACRCRATRARRARRRSP